ncbi:DUF2842 domain-containing protein [Lacimonas salitolerans]|uniref:DUF2842 domain-containing protein n=1 Tax=Lacimonas salitolerans TaxID=1323750 RepID=A0ABW4EDV9_9RHOB
MSLTYKSRKRWSLVILLVAMPLYIVAAVTLVGWLFPDPLNKPLLLELLVYLGLGIVWILPFRFVFRGIGQADPDAPEE